MTASECLAQARTGMKRMAELPAAVKPQTLTAAYDVQDGLVPLLLAYFGGEIVGYKIACTNEIAQKQLSVPHPFFGRMLAGTTQASPGKLKASEFFMMVMEAEFAFQMDRDLPPTGTPWTREQVEGAVRGVMAGIEVVDSRYDSWTTVGAASLIADNACHGAWIHGDLVTDWRGIDLAAQKVRLIINGDVKDTGTGAAVLGHPLSALTWLANTLNERGLGLKAGECVTTGVTTDIYLAGPGDRVEADFGPVGRVLLTIE